VVKVKQKLRDMVDYLEYDELVKMKKDLEMGGIHIARLVENKIKEETLKHEDHCCICNNKIEQYSVNNFTLVFGPADLRKKATFCAIDCLEYFLKNLKDIKAESKETFNKQH